MQGVHQLPALLIHLVILAPLLKQALLILSLQ
jgi:hypothetical protein